MEVAFVFLSCIVILCLWKFELGTFAGWALVSVLTLLGLPGLPGISAPPPAPPSSPGLSVTGTSPLFPCTPEASIQTWFVFPGVAGQQLCTWVCWHTLADWLWAQNDNHSYSACRFVSSLRRQTRLLYREIINESPERSSPLFPIPCEAEVCRSPGTPSLWVSDVLGTRDAEARKITEIPGREGLAF